MRWRPWAHSCSFCRRASLPLPTVRPMRPYSRPSKAGVALISATTSSSIGRNATFSSSRAGKKSGIRRSRTVCCSPSPIAPFKRRYTCSERIAGMSNASSNASFVIPLPAIPSVAVDGTAARFPVRRIFCVGRNYAAHAREMGKDPDREPPFFFMKPADTVVDSGTTIPYPPQTKELHYEMELVVALGKGGFNVPRDKALDLVFGYGCGIDLTRRDLQQQAKD